MEWRERLGLGCVRAGQGSGGDRERFADVFDRQGAVIADCPWGDPTFAGDRARRVRPHEMSDQVEVVGRYACGLRVANDLGEVLDRG